MISKKGFSGMGTMVAFFLVVVVILLSTNTLQAAFKNTGDKINDKLDSCSSENLEMVWGRCVIDETYCNSEGGEKLKKNNTYSCPTKDKPKASFCCYKPKRLEDYVG